MVTSSSHADNLEYNFLILGEGDTFGNNGSFGAPEKKFSNNFAKANTKFCLSLHYNADNSYLIVNGKGIFKFKADNENVNFINSISFRKYISNIETREISLNGNVYDFSAEYNSLDKSDILNIHNHLMRKNKIKKCSALPNRCLFRYYVLVNL